MRVPGIAIAALAATLTTGTHAGEIKLALHQMTATAASGDAGWLRHTGRRDSYPRPRARTLDRARPARTGAGPQAAHVHENPDCSPAKRNGELVPAGAAGGHFDPQKTGRHEGPCGPGHLGDLPNLTIEGNGTATIPVLAPRLKLAYIRGRALMIHAGADRYHGHVAQAHGKGGMRMYCGIIP
jgi:Cu/Zn superoxide dismutase